MSLVLAYSRNASQFEAGTSSLEPTDTKSSVLVRLMYDDDDDNGRGDSAGDRGSMMRRRWC